MTAKEFDIITRSSLGEYLKVVKYVVYFESGSIHIYSQRENKLKIEKETEEHYIHHWLIRTPKTTIQTFRDFNEYIVTEHKKILT